MLLAGRVRHLQVLEVVETVGGNLPELELGKIEAEACAVEAVQEALDLAGLGSKV